MLQWDVLAGVERIAAGNRERIAAEAARTETSVGVRLAEVAEVRDDDGGESEP